MQAIAAEHDQMIVPGKPGSSSLRAQLLALQLCVELWLGSFRKQASIFATGKKDFA